MTNTQVVICLQYTFWPLHAMKSCWLGPEHYFENKRLSLVILIELQSLWFTHLLLLLPVSVLSVNTYNWNLLQICAYIKQEPLRLHDFAPCAVVLTFHWFCWPFNIMKMSRWQHWQSVWRQLSDQNNPKKCHEMSRLRNKIKNLHVCNQIHGSLLAHTLCSLTAN